MENWLFDVFMYAIGCYGAYKIGYNEGVLFKMSERLKQIKSYTTINKENDGDRYIVYKEDLHWLVNKVELYEKALNDIVENPRDWSASYGNAYTESIRIALKALDEK